ncbi:PAS domain-containing protein [Moritella sp.]|uniref:PAS domain-containing protein n=1 Tax=Moritella sp. TaxID=78556 RepID=UPI0025F36FAB|nr:PAS domain-containing protein [Moritella sp.]
MVPLYSSTGEIDGGVGVCDDITLQQQNTANLKKLSRVVECSLDGIMITNTQGVIEYVNPRFTQIMTLLGGRIAEEIFYAGEVSTGAIDDLHRVMDIAKRMVTEHGMVKNPIFSVLQRPRMRLTMSYGTAFPMVMSGLTKCKTNVKMAISTGLK